MVAEHASPVPAGVGRHAASSLALRRAFGTVDTSSSDTHDDFKPKYKVEPVNDVNELIKKDVTSNPVFLYMKGVPAAPQCGFSDLAVKVLTAYGAWLAMQLQHAIACHH